VIIIVIIIKLSLKSKINVVPIHVFNIIISLISFFLYIIKKVQLSELNMDFSTKMPTQKKQFSDTF